MALNSLQILMFDCNVPDSLWASKTTTTCPLRGEEEGRDRNLSPKPGFVLIVAFTYLKENYFLKVPTSNMSWTGPKIKTLNLWGFSF